MVCTFANPLPSPINPIQLVNPEFVHQIKQLTNQKMLEKQ
jgi:hypothetical protein